MGRGTPIPNCDRAWKSHTSRCCHRGGGEAFCVWGNVHTCVRGGELRKLAYKELVWIVSSLLSHGPHYACLEAIRCWGEQSLPTTFLTSSSLSQRVLPGNLLQGLVTTDLRLFAHWLKVLVFNTTQKRKGYVKCLGGGINYISLINMACPLRPSAPKAVTQASELGKSSVLMVIPNSTITRFARLSSHRYQWGWEPAITSPVICHNVSESCCGGGGSLAPWKNSLLTYSGTLRWMVVPVCMPCEHHGLNPPWQTKGFQ